MTQERQVHSNQEGFEDDAVPEHSKLHQFLDLLKVGLGHAGLTLDKRRGEKQTRPSSDEQETS